MDHLETLVGCLERLQARHGHMNLHIPFGAVVTLISQVQLALRHPANVGLAASEARSILDQWIAQLEASEPAIGPLLRMGYDPYHDIERRN